MYKNPITGEMDPDRNELGVLNGQIRIVTDATRARDFLDGAAIAGRMLAAAARPDPYRHPPDGYARALGRPAPAVAAAAAPPPDAALVDIRRRAADSINGVNTAPSFFAIRPMPDGYARELALRGAATEGSDGKEQDNESRRRGEEELRESNRLADEILAALPANVTTHEDLMKLPLSTLREIAEQVRKLAPRAATDGYISGLLRKAAEDIHRYAQQQHAGDADDRRHWYLR